MAIRACLVILALAASWAAPLHAALYKSLSPEGVVTFSDLPPQTGTKVEIIDLRSTGPASGAPVIASGAPLFEQELRERDAAVARASAEVDLAEHALAMARRSIWSPPDVTKIAAARMTRTDHERVEFYKKGVLAARQNLMQVLGQKRRAAVQTMTASAETPVRTY